MEGTVMKKLMTAILTAGLLGTCMAQSPGLPQLL